MKDVKIDPLTAIIIIIPTLIVGGIVGAITMAIVKNRVFKELLKKHDKETAERMAKEFKAQLKKIKEEYEGDKEEMAKQMQMLCNEFGVDPAKVFKTKK
jgi:ClpP class serine protease